MFTFHASALQKEKLYKRTYNEEMIHVRCLEKDSKYSRRE